MGRLGSILLLLLSSTAPTGSASGDDWERRLQEGAPKDWAALEELGSRLRCTYSIDETAAGGKERPPRHYDRTAAIHGERLMLTDKINGKEIVDCTNPSYMFSLSKGSGSESFSLNYMAPSDARDPQFDRSIEKVKGEVFDDVHSAWYMNGRPLADWFRRSGFKVLGVRRVDEPEQGLVEVRFEYRDAGLDRRQDISDGRLVLDPARKWTIREYECGKYWGTLKKTCAYDGEVDGFPRLREYRKVMLGKDKTSATTVVKYEELELGAVPDSAFTLAAFGLPEPGLTPTPVLATTLWFLGAAVVLGVAAHLLRRRLNQPAANLE